MQTIFSLGFAPFDTMGIISLIAATTNAFNGALLARRPSHYQHFSVIGVIILGYIGGIGGGTMRDILCNRVPTPLINPWYLIACLIATSVAIAISYYSAVKFQDGLFQFMTAFSLPWYAIVGAQTAVDVHLGYFAAVIIGVIATTGGRFIIDVACNDVPKQLVRGHFFVVTAAATSVVYLVLHQALGWSAVIATAVAFFFGFGFRLTSQALNWEEWEPWEPEGLTAGEKARPTIVSGLHAEFAAPPREGP